MTHGSHASRTVLWRVVLAAVGVLVALYGVVGFPNADELVPGAESVLGRVSEAAADTRENCITEFLGATLPEPVCTTPELRSCVTGVYT